MCNTTHTHYACFCIALVVHSCAYNYPHGRLVCPPPYLKKKHIYVYADCDDCLIAAEERNVNFAKKASRAWMRTGEREMNNGEEREGENGDGNEDEEGESVEEVRLECEEGGDEAGEGEIYDMDRETRYNVTKTRKKHQHSKTNEDKNSDEDAQLSAAQLAGCQFEIEESENSPDENDDMAAAAQLLSALRQELGDTDMIIQSGDVENENEGGGEDEDEDEDGDKDKEYKEYKEHVQTILENLGKLRDERNTHMK
ncbi:3541f1cf-c08c-49b2-89d9-9a24c4047bc4 [Sclerotinia trifoliorum]|uniref:3541f1cf-c08c-49b2-89d9-9a24c4047bc4 n=1 Tax=Sclerotinia trifoliorum TaxID=28548 RepID=A0A8H2VT31_9HELO|nr:3541f1cf-c08c-49b2-89d9-9a24c4047bc4 [Sclerotinia trifoliorum]